MRLRLTKGFQWYLQQIPAADQDEAVGAAEALAERLAHLPPGPDQARTLHRRLSELQEAYLLRRPDLARLVRCGKGCSACCRMWVGITQDEAQLLAQRVREGVVIDSRRLALQAACPDPTSHFQLGPESARCVFLGRDGACRVHEDRPSACRLVLVASDPALCATADFQTRIAAVIAPDAELLASAALSACPAQGDGGLSLARGLHAALQEP